MVCGKSIVKIQIFSALSILIKDFSVFFTFFKFEETLNAVRSAVFIRSVLRKDFLFSVVYDLRLFCL
jgi:hypothetical protein